MKEFDSFRIVGGTSLSLQLGHRESIDIDLFTDAEYGSLDFNQLEQALLTTFPFVELPTVEIVGMGKSYFIGNSESELVKLDLFYTEPFVFPCIIEQNIRFASIEEIAAMKFEVIGQGGRKKRFLGCSRIVKEIYLRRNVEFLYKKKPLRLF